MFAHAVGTCDLMVYQAIPFLAESKLEAGAKALSDVASAGFALYLVGQSGVALAVAWANKASRVFPQWLTVLGYPVAALSLVGSFGAVVTSSRFVAGGGPLSGICLGVFLTWYASLDIVLVARPSASQS